MPRRFVSGSPGQESREIGDRVDALSIFPPFGSVVSHEFLAATESRVFHGLRRKPRGYIVVKTDGANDLFESNVSPQPNRFLLMQNTAAAEMDIWFF